MREQKETRCNLNSRNHSNSIGGNHCGTFDIGRNYHSTSTK